MLGSLGPMERMVLDMQSVTQETFEQYLSSILGARACHLCEVGELH